MSQFSRLTNACYQTTRENGHQGPPSQIKRRKNVSRLCYVEVILGTCNVFLCFRGKQGKKVIELFVPILMPRDSRERRITCDWIQYIE